MHPVSEKQINFEQSFQIGQWMVEPALNTLTLINTNMTDTTNHEKETLVRKVTPKVMALCVYLAKHYGHPVSQNEIAETIWPERIISDSSIYQAIAQLRKALDYDATTYIERISGKGYRLLMAVSQPNATATLLSKRNVAIIPLHKKLTLRIIAFSALVIFMVIGIWYAQSDQDKPETDTPVIAILPIQNLTQPKLNSFDPFNQLLLSDLVSQPKLKFIHLRKNIDNVNANLKLFTTVQQAQNSLLMSVQLIRQQDKSVLWAKSFYAQPNELLMLKNKVVQALLHYLIPANHISNNKIKDPHFENYALARYLWDKREVEALTRAKTLFSSILSEDPNHIGSLTGLCHTYLYLSVYSTLPEKKAYDECAPLISLAYKIAPQNGQVMITQAILLMAKKNNTQAEALFHQALIAAPNYAMGHHWFGNFLRQTGRYNLALTSHKMAYSLDPLSPIIIRGLAYAYLNMRNLNSAKKYYQRALTIEPNYSHRAVQELDFLPLNQTRAKAFLSWINSSAENIGNSPEYKLSQALIWLSLGDITLAKNLIETVDKHEINPSFLYYVQAALASANNDNQLVLNLLKKRLELTPDIPRNAMPYISALQNNGLSVQALTVFQRYFPEISLKSDITNENAAQFIFLASLLKNNQHKTEQQAVTNKLRIYFSQDNGQLTTLQKIYWYNLLEQKDLIVKQVNKLLEQHWLPDYNDDLFSENRIKTFYLESGGKAHVWQSKLLKNRQLKNL